MVKGKPHYAWVVFIGCCALSGGMGFLPNTLGQWFVPVTTELNATTAQMALYFTVMGICMALIAPVVGRTLPKVDTRILLTGCYLVCILVEAAMSQFTAIWMWYIAGAITGLAGCFVFIMPIPIILGNWFHKKSGLVIGIAMATCGLVGAIANPIIAALIPIVGWRMMFVINAIVTAVITLPCTLFLIRFKPEDKGLKPYGYDEASEEQTDAQTDAQTEVAPAASELTGVTPQRAYRSVAFWLMFLNAGMFALFSGFSSVLPTYMNSIGMLAIIGLISTAAQIGSTLGKFALGAISDRIGAVKSAVLGLVLGIVGFLLLAFSAQIVPLALAGAFLFGTTLALNSVSTPTIGRMAFGGKYFSTLYATLSMGASFIGAFSTTLVGLSFDVLGTFQPAMIAGVVLCVILIVTVLTTLKLAQRLPRE